MREGLDAPTFELPPENVRAIRAFLDGQSPIRLAVWVRHEQQGVDGPMYDHHLVLGVDDEDWAGGDMPALEQGMDLPWPAVSEPIWVEVSPVSEVERLRAFGTVLWEQPEEPTEGLDPLDFRYTHEPVEVAAEALARFRSLVRSVAPDVVRVTATRSRLWKGDREVEADTSLSIAWELFSGPSPGPLHAVLDAAREAGIQHDGGGIVRPQEEPGPEATVLYDAAEAP